MQHINWKILLNDTNSPMPIAFIFQPAVHSLQMLHSSEVFEIWINRIPHWNHCFLVIIVANIKFQTAAQSYTFILITFFIEHYCNSNTSAH